MRALLLFSLIFLVSACDRPHFYQSSYLHHNHENIYKSPPGPEAGNIGYPYSEVKNAKVISEFKDASDHLVTSLEAGRNLEAQKIFVQTKEKPSAFENAFDHALRQTLLERGYVLGSAAETFDARIVYDVTALSGSQNTIGDLFKPKQKDEDHFNVLLNYYNGNPEPQIIEQTYKLPAYGYRYIKDQKDYDAEMNRHDERTQNFYVGGERVEQ